MRREREKEKRIEGGLVEVSEAGNKLFNYKECVTMFVPMNWNLISLKFQMTCVGYDLWIYTCFDFFVAIIFAL